MRLLKKTSLTISLLSAGLILPSSVLADSAKPDLHIRSIASSCFACHGTSGNPAVSNFSITHKTLAGMPANKFEKKMLAFKNGDAESTIMHHHAESLRLEEIKGLALFFSKQKVKKSTLPPQQKLEVSHD